MLTNTFNKLVGDVICMLHYVIAMTSYGRMASRDHST